MAQTATQQRKRKRGMGRCRRCGSRMIVGRKAELDPTSQCWRVIEFYCSNRAACRYGLRFTFDGEITKSDDDRLWLKDLDEVTDDLYLQYAGAGGRPTDA